MDKIKSEVFFEVESRLSPGNATIRWQRMTSNPFQFSPMERVNYLSWLFSNSSIGIRYIMLHKKHDRSSFISKLVKSYDEAALLKTSRYKPVTRDPSLTLDEDAILIKRLLLFPKWAITDEKLDKQKFQEYLSFVSHNNMPLELVTAIANFARNYTVIDENQHRELAKVLLTYLIDADAVAEAEGKNADYENDEKRKTQLKTIVSQMYKTGILSIVNSYKSRFKPLEVPYWLHPFNYRMHWDAMPTVHSRNVGRPEPSAASLLLMFLPIVEFMDKLYTYIADSYQDKILREKRGDMAELLDDAISEVGDDDNMLAAIYLGAKIMSKNDEALTQLVDNAFSKSRLSPELIESVSRTMGLGADVDCIPS